MSMLKLADYLYSTPDIQWRFAEQMGVRNAVGRMPDGHMDEVAENYELLKAMRDTYKENGFHLAAIEPACSNQKIKRNLPGRDEEIDRMLTLIRNMGKLEIETLCYNFTAYFNWVRTRYQILERGGALVTGYCHDDWNQSVITEAGIVTQDELWNNMEYFQKAIVPVAEEAGVHLALHPDDPPQPYIQHVGRILTSADAMERAINIVPSKMGGICMCQGSFALMGEDIVQCIHRFGNKGKINLVHFRDVRGDKNNFHETFHDNGMTDMAACIDAYAEAGVDAYVRVDHVPTMAGEEDNKPGYESLGRLYAIGYLKGLMEMQGYKSRKKMMSDV
jgi:mannonate dehydratase